VTATSKANNKADPNIRPYSLTVVEKLDRVVTGSKDMMGAQASRHRDRSSLGIGGHGIGGQTGLVLWENRVS
jgi:hypothetical protein